MTAFLTPVDIANRALQHCGAARIDPTQGFEEDTEGAAECAFAYDKLRAAELRRNVWRFSIRTVALRPVDTDTQVIQAVVWSSTTTYFLGSLCADVQGNIWQSLVPNNLNNQPGNSDAWELYFGPRTVSLYDSGTNYFSGELVYKTPGDGTYKVYFSRVNDNDEDPATATAYSATVTYDKNNIVDYNGTLFMSVTDLNMGQTPHAQWVVSTTYAAGDIVSASDNYLYTSVGNGNVGNNPITDGGTNWTQGAVSTWTNSITDGAGSGSVKWLELDVMISPLLFTYPIGTGPSSASGTRNVFRLPVGYLRQAAQDPKAGSVSFLGAPSGQMYDDWNLEGDYIISREVQPIMFRFVADISDVRRMDDMFCEGLAARLGMEICPRLTQSGGKVATIAQMYKQVMTDARIVNGIETGPEEPPEDDYITCRV